MFLYTFSFIEGKFVLLKPITLNFNIDWHQWHE